MTPSPKPDRPSLQDRLLASPIVRAILWPALYFGVGGLEPVKKPPTEPPAEG